MTSARIDSEFVFTHPSGIIFGVVIRYAVPASQLSTFEVVVARPSYNICDSVEHLLSTGSGKVEEVHNAVTGNIRYAVGEKIVIKGYSFEQQTESGDELVCQISGKYFKRASSDGNIVQQAVSRDGSLCKT